MYSSSSSGPRFLNVSLNVWLRLNPSSLSVAARSLIFDRTFSSSPTPECAARGTGT